MNSAAKNTGNDKPVDDKRISDIHELGEEETLSLEGAEDITEEVTGIRKTLKGVTTPPPLPLTEVQQNLLQIQSMEKERVADEIFQKKVPQAYRIDPRTGKKERIAPFKPQPKIRDERDLQGT